MGTAMGLSFLDVIRFYGGSTLITLIILVLVILQS